MSAERVGVPQIAGSRSVLVPCASCLDGPALDPSPEDGDCDDDFPPDSHHASWNHDDMHSKDTAAIAIPAAAPIDEVGALVGTLLATPEVRVTMCAGWTAHELAAHLAAGAAEEATLIERRLQGLPDRSTKEFESRERPYRDLPDAGLRDRLVEESVHLSQAIGALGDETVEFTGRRMNRAEFLMHSRSECALHQWDLVGRDEIGWSILSQPELTDHAVRVLTTMTISNEALGPRLGTVHQDAKRVVLRGAPHADIVFVCGTRSIDVVRQSITPATPDIEVEPAQRLLMLWGRREPSSPIDAHTTAGHRLVRSLLAARGEERP